MSQYAVCTLYKFVSLENFEEMREPLLRTMKDHQICGTLLLAREGINGTIAGSREGIESFLEALKKDPRLTNIEYKESYSEKRPFRRTKVKLKKEIVTMGLDGIDPNKKAGSYVTPEEWNQLINNPDVVLVDTRNKFEIKIGTFKGAINPNINNFREFPEYIKENLMKYINKKLAMFCTGGIRCEKATSLLKEQGFQSVYHLKGGILKYLENIPKAESLWEGECFVFDDRVSVQHNLEKGSYDQCYACRMPISDEDKKSQKYQKGVSCPYCYDHVSLEDKARFMERERQNQLAKLRDKVPL